MRMRWTPRRPGPATAALAVLALAAGATEASAQIRLGAQASSADNSGFGIGPRLQLDLGPFDAGLRLVGSFEVYFPGDDFVYAGTSLRDLERADVPTDGIDQDYWELNVNVLYTFGLPAAPVTPYVGGGLNFAHITRTGSPGEIIDVDQTDRGLNVLGGVELDLAGITPFFEVRYALDGGDQWVLTGGFFF